MKLIHLALALAAVPAAVFAANANFSIPGGSQSSTFVISTSGIYSLAASRVMTDNTKNAIEITVPDVTVDLNGCTISYASVAGGSGIGINIPTAVNVEIRNGSITNVPMAAIRSDGATGSGLRVIDVRVAGSRGIASKAAATLVDRCHVTDTSSAAAIWIGALDGVVRNCQVRNVVTASGIAASGGTQIIGNTIDTTAYSAIYVGPTNAGETGGIVARNVIRRANQGGFAWHGGMNIYGVGVMITDNNVHDCKGAGIGAMGSGLLVASNHIVGTTTTATGAGHAIFTQFADTIIRSNSALLNAGNLIQGPYIDAGGNVGN
jgi:hypothetical protein